MSSIPYNAENGNEISSSVTNFMTQFVTIHGLAD